MAANHDKFNLNNIDIKYTNVEKRKNMIAIWIAYSADALNIFFILNSFFAVLSTLYPPRNGA